MEDLDEESREKRKREQLEFRSRQKTSRIFMLAASAFEIIETLILILVLFVVMAAVLFKFFDANSHTVQIVFQILTIVIFIGGMVGGFFIYKAAVRWAIKKFGLEEKLLDDVKRHYIKQTEEERLSELKR